MRNVEHFPTQRISILIFPFLQFLLFRLGGWGVDVDAEHIRPYTRHDQHHKAGIKFVPLLGAGLDAGPGGHIVELSITPDVIFNAAIELDRIQIAGECSSDRNGGQSNGEVTHQARTVLVRPSKNKQTHQRVTEWDE